MARVARLANEEEALPEPTGRLVRNKINLIRSNRGLSLDGVCIGDVKELPTKGHDELASLFSRITQERKWPKNISLVPIGLHPKPGGGDRPIGITAALPPSSSKSMATSYLLGTKEPWISGKMR